MDALRRSRSRPATTSSRARSSREDMRSPAFAEKMKKGPVVGHDGDARRPMSMGRNLVLWFLYIVVDGRVCRRTSRAARCPPARSYLQVFRFAGATAFIGYAAALWQMSIWYRRAWMTTIKATVDGLIYALADRRRVRLALAAIVRAMNELSWRWIALMATAPPLVGPAGRVSVLEEAPADSRQHRRHGGDLRRRARAHPAGVGRARSHRPRAASTPATTASPRRAPSRATRSTPSSRCSRCSRCSPSASASKRKSGGSGYDPEWR